MIQVHVQSHGQAQQFSTIHINDVSQFQIPDIGIGQSGGGSQLVPGNPAGCDQVTDKS
jgi:hypothetical protein